MKLLKRIFLLVVIAIFFAVSGGVTSDACAHPSLSKHQHYGPAIIVDPAPVRVAATSVDADGVFTARGKIDGRLLAGLLKKYESRLARRDPRKGVIRRFLQQDGNLELLAWQLENDATIQLEPMPDTGKPLNDWLTWFITNIDEIIAAIQKIIGLFDTIGVPETAYLEQLEPGLWMADCQWADGRHEKITYNVAA